jgi:hypothetical protein
MRRVLLLVSLLACLGYLMADPGKADKVHWCHYPPGQWTGVPGTASHVLILDISDSAEPGHLGHSPSLTGGPTCNPLATPVTTATGTTWAGCAEGVTADGKADECPGVTAPGPTCPIPPQVCALYLAGVCTGGLVTEVQGPITEVINGVTHTLGHGDNACVCPAGTNNAGSVPNMVNGVMVCGGLG